MSRCEHCGEITLATACASLVWRQGEPHAIGAFQAKVLVKARVVDRIGRGSTGFGPLFGGHDLQPSLQTSQLSQAPDSAPPLASSSSSHKHDSSISGPRIRSRPTSQTQPSDPTIAQSELLLKLSRARTSSELSLQDLRQLTEPNAVREDMNAKTAIIRQDSSKRSASTSPSRKWDAAHALDATKLPPSPSRPTVQFFEDTAPSSTLVVRKMFSAFDLSKSTNRDSTVGTPTVPRPRSTSPSKSAIRTSRPRMLGDTPPSSTFGPSSSLPTLSTAVAFTFTNPSPNAQPHNNSTSRPSSPSKLAVRPPSPRKPITFTQTNENRALCHRPVSTAPAPELSHLGTRVNEE